MQLRLKETWGNYAEYFCEITEKLDELSGLVKTSKKWDGLKHYILIDDYSLKHNFISIRVPGGTVGTIFIDDGNEITNIKIDTNYTIKTYPKNVERQIRELFIGKKIEGIKK